MTCKNPNWTNNRRKLLSIETKITATFLECEKKDENDLCYRKQIDPERT